MPVFKDPRYIKVDGKPVFLVYRIGHLPEPTETIRRWREEADRAGLPGLYLANVESFADEHGAASRLPLDAAVEFAPDWECLARRRGPFRRAWASLQKRAGRPVLDRIWRYPAVAEAMRRGLLD